MVLTQLQRGVSKGQLADVRALNEYRRDPAVLCSNGLVNEVEDSLFRNARFDIAIDDLDASAPWVFDGIGAAPVS